MRSEQAKTFIEAIGFFGKKEEKAITAINDLKNNKTKFNPNVDTVPREIWEQFEPESWAEIGRDLGYTVPKSMREATRYAPSRQKLLQIAKSAQNERLELFATSDIFWDEIKEMKVLEGSFTVYDITVPELHNFVANDIIVHNSYSMGVIAEGIADLPLDMRKRLAVVILDTMGIYWTMRYPNHQDESLLQEWNLRGKPLDITIFTPQGFYKDYKEKGIPTDFPFAIKPSELSAQDWFITFELNENNPVAIIIERVILQLQEELHTGKREDYTIADIINTIQNMEDEVESSRKAAVNRFKSAAQWGIFDNAGTPLWEIVKPGRVSVLDVSAYATAANGWKIKNLVVGLVSQKLFLQRMVSRKEEEAKAIQSSVHYISSGAQEIQDEPMVWLIIDEAHEFLPNQGKTAATDALVTLLREGRQPGISMILATQQPGKIHTDVMTQSDIFLSHHITARLDTDALGALMQSYLRKGLDVELNNLPKIKGAALVLDDVNERLFPMKIRPRITWHGGSAPEVLRKEKNIFEF